MWLNGIPELLSLLLLFPDLTGALLASAQLLPFHSNKDKGLLGEG